jgi:predicted TIM-barrel fold metal-dependent hydrolase
MTSTSSTVLNRREFLAKAAAASLLVREAAGRRAVAGDAPRPMRIDTHLHCFAGNDQRFPYHPRAPYRPPAATPEHLLKCMDGAGVDYSIVVHPEPYQDDHRYLEHCLAVGKERVKGTCLVFADQPDSVSKLSDLAKRLPVVTTRIHAYAPDRLPPFGKPELRNLWKKATDLGLALQLHFEPRYAPGFEPLIKEFTTTKVIIDHLGRPFQGTPEEHETVVKWARFENTVMKLSAIPAAETYPHRNIAPVIKRLVTAFGPTRVIYGGGFGAEATAESYRAAFERARSFIDFLSADDQANIFGLNAARLFGFKLRR